MAGSESYGRGNTDESSREVQNAEQMPLIECGIAAIRVGLFVNLKRRFVAKYGAQRAIPIAYCVTCSVLCEQIDQPTLAAFARTNKNVIDSETSSVFSDEHLAGNILFAYAALMILHGWRSANPFSSTANQLMERATDSGAVIPNIVQMWGSEAIARFSMTAQEFMAQSVSGTNV